MIFVRKIITIHDAFFSFIHPFIEVCHRWDEKSTHLVALLMIYWPVVRMSVSFIHKKNLLYYDHSKINIVIHVLAILKNKPTLCNFLKVLPLYYLPRHYAYFNLCYIKAPPSECLLAFRAIYLDMEKTWPTKISGLELKNV